MTWVTANPIAAMFLAVCAVVGLLWFVSWARGEITVEYCDHSECERPEYGDTVIEIFETSKSAGDGVESGV